MFINLVLIEDIKLVHAAIILTQSRIRSRRQLRLREVEAALELEFVSEVRQTACRDRC